MKCKYCNKEATKKGYRDNCGVVSSEVTCNDCFWLVNPPYPYEEGTDYYTIEGKDIIWSCWDDQSEEMFDSDPSKNYYSTVVDAMRDDSLIGVEEVKVFDYNNNIYTIKL